MASGPAPGSLCVISGASGFIGCRLSRRLLAEGYAVRGLVRATSDTTALRALGVELVIGDLTRPATLAPALAGATDVVHCGALVSDWATVAEIRAVNVAGTRNLLDGAVAAGARRFIHLSSTDVYGHPTAAAAAGPARAHGRFDEQRDWEGFANWYSQTKREAEAEVRLRNQAIETVILRPATVYGPGSRELVGEIARAIRARQMLLIGRGRADAGLLYVENLLDAVLLSLRDRRAAGEIFNVGDGLGLSWREFTDDLAAGLGCERVRLSAPYPLALGLGLLIEQAYRALRRATGVSSRPLLSRQAVQVLGRSQAFSSAKLTEMLGWSPRVDYREGLSATLEWLREDFFGAL